MYDIRHQGTIFDMRVWVYGLCGPGRHGDADKKQAARRGGEPVRRLFDCQGLPERSTTWKIIQGVTAYLPPSQIR